MKIFGGREAAADLLGLAKKSPEAMVRALEKYGNARFNESQELVPVETGELKESGVADKPEWEGNRLAMEIGYGGTQAEEYAAIVHEDMEAHHDQGQAKYLEQPLNEAEEKFESEIGGDFVKFAGID